jgi:hypothetical protein
LVQVCKPPPAAEGFSPIPGGSVTLASLTLDCACFVFSCKISPADGGSKGTLTATEGPLGESVAAVSGETASDGSKGIESHSLGEVPGGILDSKKDEPAGKLGSGSP